MEFGINNFFKKNLRSFLDINFFIASRKKKRLQKEFKNNKVKIGYFSSITKSNLGKEVYIGDKISIYCSNIGDYSYVNSNSQIRNSVIGKFCSIGSKVIIGMGNHPVGLVSTHPSFYSNNKAYKTFSEKNYFNEYLEVKVGNDVWIGYGAIIMGGIKIGDGAVIAAGSIVTKDVEPYSIVGGVPAKNIKYRFSKEIIEGILATKWWDKDESWLKENYLLFHDIDKFLKVFNYCKVH